MGEWRGMGEHHHWDVKGPYLCMTREEKAGFQFYSSGFSTCDSCDFFLLSFLSFLMALQVYLFPLSQEGLLGAMGGSVKSHSFVLNLPQSTETWNTINVHISRNTWVCSSSPAGVVTFYTLRGECSVSTTAPWNVLSYYSSIGNSVRSHWVSTWRSRITHFLAGATE